MPASLHRIDSLCGVVELFRGRGVDRRSSPGAAVVTLARGRKILKFAENSLCGRHADIVSFGGGGVSGGEMRWGIARCGLAALTTRY